MGAVNAKWLAVCRKGTRPQEQLSGLSCRRRAIGAAFQPHRQMAHVRLLIASGGLLSFGLSALKIYQGMTFFNPFFFLLVDSFLGSAELESAGFV
jgi:hypothetical protein